MEPFLTEERRQVLATIRQFVEQDVKPVARELEKRDEYPFATVERLKELGLFGAFIPEAYGGLGLDYLTYAMVIEEICKGWMSVSGIINSHLMMAYAVWQFGTEAQRQKWLPSMCRGEKRGGVGLTEPHAGTDLQAITTTALRKGDGYVLSGTKMFITNGRYGNVFAILTKTDPGAVPAHKGISLFLVEKGHPGFIVSRNIEKLGYKGVETCELVFEDVPVPAENLIGEREGQGFAQIMSGLEVGRINVAARGVGVAQAAFEDSIRYAQQRQTFGKPIAEHQAIQLKLADMATKIEAARFLVYSAAMKKDRGERCDLEAGMAKRFPLE